MEAKAKNRRTKINNESLVMYPVVDTLTGEQVKISLIEKEIYETKGSLDNPHLLSLEHSSKRRELPY